MHGSGNAGNNWFSYQHVGYRFRIRFSEVYFVNTDLRYWCIHEAANITDTSMRALVDVSN
jgi:hypothetical protein